MATAKIASAQPKLRPDGTQAKFDGQRGTTWYCIVKLDNGMEGEVGQQTEGCRWKEGDEVTYEYKPNEKNPQYMGKLSLKKIDGGRPYGGGGYSGGGKTFDTTGVEVGHAISSAISILSIAAKQQPSIQDIEIKAKEILALSDRMKSERRADNAAKAASETPQQESPSQQQQASTPSTKQDAGKPSIKKGDKTYNAILSKIQAKDPNVNIDLLKPKYDISDELVSELKRLQQEYMSADDDLPF